MPRLTKYIPSMFHRRVLLLAVMVVGAFGLLVFRLGWMTLGEHGVEARIDASKLLMREHWFRTVRGTIYDRKGRVLAQDLATYDIAVDYRVLAGQWVYEDRKGKHGIDIPLYALRLARRYNAQIWDMLDEAQRDEVVDAFESALRGRVKAMYVYISEQTETPMDELMARRDAIVERVSKVKADYTARTRRSLIKAHEQRGNVPNADDLDRIERKAMRPIVEEEQAHTLVEDVSDALGFTFILQSEKQTALVVRVSDDIGGEVTPGDDEREALLPGLTVLDATARLYPKESKAVEVDRSSFPPPLVSDQPITLIESDIGSMVLGSVRKGVQAEDVDRRRRALEEDALLAARSTTAKGTDRGRYKYHDQIGRTGIEKAYEDHLRGLRGVRVENLQTGESTEIGSTPGLDIHLTLDIMLQARIRAILDPRLGLARVQPWHHNSESTMPIGTELDAGVIVLEVATGDILAMVSTPVPPGDGDWSRYGVGGSEAQKRLYMEIHTPYTNRAIAMPYPPGSVAKAVILNGAAKYGKYTQGERIKATGHLFPNQPNKYRSWYYKVTNGTQNHYDQLGRDPNDIDALMVSSNVFFFTLGQRLRAEGITKTYQDFGVGTAFNLGVGQEWPGSIGALGGPGDGTDLTQDNAIMMGIGQGPITWTPLHAADAFATIARQGFAIKPRIIRDGKAPEVRDLGLLAWSVRDTLEGLHEVVSNTEFGSGYGIRYQEFAPHTPTFNAPGIRVWGKTGTATAPSILFDPDEDNGTTDDRIVVRQGDHSWFVTLVGREGGEPEYAIAVVVDYAGSGGRVSGPINNQIIHALIEEGYLPKVQADGDQR